MDGWMLTKLSIGDRKFGCFSWTHISVRWLAFFLIRSFSICKFAVILVVTEQELCSWKLANYFQLRDWYYWRWFHRSADCNAVVNLVNTWEMLLQFLWFHSSGPLLLFPNVTLEFVMYSMMFQHDTMLYYNRDLHSSPSSRSWCLFCSNNGHALWNVHSVIDSPEL